MKCPICDAKISAESQRYCEECGISFEAVKELITAGRDGAKGIEWMAEDGNPEAKNILGVSYALGRGGKPYDPQKARSYFEDASVLGSTNAQYNLASFYYQGLGGLEKNVYEAENWLRQAAEKGHKEAQKALMWCFEGTGTAAYAVEGYLPLIGMGRHLAKKAGSKMYQWKLQG